MKLIERELAETERLRFGADADRRRLRCELAAANKGWQLSGQSNELCLRELYKVRDELTAAQAECERLKDEILAIGAKPMFYHPQSYAATRANEIQQERQLNELARLRAEVERYKDDYRDAGKHISLQVDRAEKAEAEIAAMKGTP
jgi:chromosome segregation ATPase